MQAHFQNLSYPIITAIEQARHDIKIAVCWFTLPEIFDVLMKKAEQKISVSIIINFDQLNFQSSGLDFKKLSEKGAKIFCYVGHGLLHHKFLIVDNQKVIVGSYNWTRSTHHDSIVEIENEKTATDYVSEWNTLLPFCKNFDCLDKKDARAVSIAHLFQPSFWTLNDLRRNIIKGANVWVARMSEKEVFNSKNQKFPSWHRCQKQQIWYLPECKTVIQKAIQSQGIFHQNIFQNIDNESLIKEKGFTKAKIFTKKCTVGDVVLALQKNEILAIGVMMDEPFFDEQLGLSVCVEWQVLKPARSLDYSFSAATISKINNGALALLAQLLANKNQ